MNDKTQLTYIRDRYNVLLDQKEQMEVAAKRLSWFKDLKVYVDVVAEMMEIDEKRTNMANPKNCVIDVRKIRVVQKKKKVVEKRTEIFVTAGKAKYPCLMFEYVNEKNAYKKTVGMAERKTMMITHRYVDLYVSPKAMKNIILQNA